MLWRACFVFVLLLIIQERVIWFRLGANAPDPLATLAQRLDALGLQNNGHDQNGLIQATAPGCAITFPVGLFALDGGEDARIATILPPGSEPLYIYLGKVAPARVQLHPVAAWLGADIAAMLGRRHTQPPTKLVMSAVPGECTKLADLDWASVSQ